MTVADSQDTYTLMHSASTGEKHRSTWAFSCSHVSKKGSEHLNGDRHMADICQFCAPDSGEEFTQVYQAALQSCPQEVFQRVGRGWLLERILRRLRTERGQETFNRTWRGIPDGLTADEEMHWLIKEFEADSVAEEHFRTWAMQLRERFDFTAGETAGAFVLPAPPPTSRWQSQHLWVTGIISDKGVREAPAVKRIGARHWRYLLEALSFYADNVTGHSVAASHSTIAAKAAELHRDHPDWDLGGRGRPTSKLQACTLEKHVKVLVSTLRSTGWIVERARGRHLTLMEACIAQTWFGIHQERAASVLDLVTPDRAVKEEATLRPCPGWASEANPFVWRLVARKLWAATGKLALLSPYPLRALALSNYLLIVGLLKKAQVLESASSPKKHKKKHRWSNLPDPTPAAKKTAQQLRAAWTWLLPKTKTGKRMDPRVIARIIDQEGCAGFSARQITQFVDNKLALNGWEIHTSLIANKLGWFRVVLRDLNAPLGGVNAS